MYDIELKNFQVACVDNVIDKCKYDDNKEIIVKAPTIYIDLILYHIPV